MRSASGWPPRRHEDCRSRALKAAEDTELERRALQQLSSHFNGWRFREVPRERVSQRRQLPPDGRIVVREPALGSAYMWLSLVVWRWWLGVTGTRPRARYQRRHTGRRIGRGERQRMRRMRMMMMEEEGGTGGPTTTASEEDGVGDGGGDGGGPDPAAEGGEMRRHRGRGSGPSGFHFFVWFFVSFFLSFSRPPTGHLLPASPSWSCGQRASRHQEPAPQTPRENELWRSNLQGIQM